MSILEKYGFRTTHGLRLAAVAEPENPALQALHEIFEDCGDDPRDAHFQRLELEERLGVAREMLSRHRDFFDRLNEHLLESEKDDGASKQEVETCQRLRKWIRTHRP